MQYSVNSFFHKFYVDDSIPIVFEMSNVFGTLLSGFVNEHVVVRLSVGYVSGIVVYETGDYVFVIKIVTYYLEIVRAVLMLYFWFAS